MSRTKPNPDDVKMLPDSSAEPAADRPIVTTTPSRQLSELPKDELENLAEEFGLSPGEYKTRQHLVAAMHERRQLIASFARDALLDVARWGRRPLLQSATKEQIAQEIIRIKSMRFAGLSQPGLYILARLRGVACAPADDVPVLVKKLKKQEGFFTRLNRKRRALLGSIVSNMIGENPPAESYQFLPPTSGDPAAPAGSAAAPNRGPTIKEDIEEAGLFGGIAGRIKKSADQYLNQKLDEIEQRIDRKLDEIDRRLGEWRDKEIANRIKILKITLWASVIVGAFSLIYSYIVETFRSAPPPPPGQIRDTRPAAPK